MTQCRKKQVAIKAWTTTKTIRPCSKQTKQYPVNSTNNIENYNKNIVLKLYIIIQKNTIPRKIYSEWFFLKGSSIALPPPSAGFREPPPERREAIEEVGVLNRKRMLIHGRYLSCVCWESACSECVGSRLVSEYLFVV